MQGPCPVASRKTLLAASASTQALLDDESCCDEMEVFACTRHSSSYQHDVLKSKRPGRAKERRNLPNGNLAGGKSQDVRGW
jgi:hypothetical protein